MNYIYECQGQTKNLKDQETHLEHKTYFFVECNKCSNVPVFHLLTRGKVKEDIKMNFKNDNYPKVDYDHKTTLLIKGALFDLLKEVEHTNCATCNNHLNLNNTTIYDHDGGWELIDSIPKQWVSVPCSCGYENSISKLGVSK